MQMIHGDDLVALRRVVRRLKRSKLDPFSTTFRMFIRLQLSKERESLVPKVLFTLGVHSEWIPHPFCELTFCSVSNANFTRLLIQHFPSSPSSQSMLHVPVNIIFYGNALLELGLHIHLLDVGGDSNPQLLVECSRGTQSAANTKRECKKLLCFMFHPVSWNCSAQLHFQAIKSDSHSNRSDAHIRRRGRWSCAKGSKPKVQHVLIESFGKQKFPFLQHLLFCIGMGVTETGCSSESC